MCNLVILMILLTKASEGRVLCIPKNRHGKAKKDTDIKARSLTLRILSHE